TVEKLQEKLAKQSENVEKEQEKLDKLSEEKQLMIDMELTNVGINEQGAEGLVQLDKSIEENRKKLEKLKEQKESGKELTDEEIKQIEKLEEQIEKHEDARLKIAEQYDAYNELNNLADTHYGQLNKNEKKNIDILTRKTDINVKDGDILGQINEQNTE